jgi:hypothetical protein
MRIHIDSGATVHIHGVPAGDIPGKLIELPARACSCSAAPAVAIGDTPAFGELWPGQGGY